MKITFSTYQNIQVNFNGKNKVIKKFIATEETINGFAYKTVKDLNNKLVRTVLKDSKNNPWVLTEFKNGLPQDQYTFDIFNNPEEIYLHRTFSNGISTNLFKIDKSCYYEVIPE